jgi:hypothetical protein
MEKIAMRQFNIIKNIGAIGLLMLLFSISASAQESNVGQSQCLGDYSDFLGRLSPQNQAYESSPDANYT